MNSSLRFCYYSSLIVSMLSYLLYSTMVLCALSLGQYDWNASNGKVNREVIENLKTSFVFNMRQRIVKFF